MSSKKRVSVFARLGPAGPTSPDETVPSHRRYSSDKHLEKIHHPHPLPPSSTHTPLSHTHSASRDESLRERERKPSHSNYEDKKQLHYRDVPPPPLPPPSRHRSHKHYHDDPDHLEYPDEPQRDMSRSEKRSSLPSVLPPPPPAPRKSHDLADRLSPTGKDILSKPFMGYEDKLKLSRGVGGGGEGGRGAGGGGGGKGKRTTPPGVGGKRTSPPEGGTGSEGEMGEGRDEGRRKRLRSEKKARLEGGGHEDVGRRSSKPHHVMERDMRERGGGGGGGKEKPERERQPPPPSTPLSEGGVGVGEGKDGQGRPERGGGRGEEREGRRGEEREGRRKRDEDWSESRDLGRKRKRESSGGTATPPPDPSTKRGRIGESAGSKDHTTDTRQPVDGTTPPSHDDKHSRAPKDAETADRKRRYDDSGKESPLPSSKKPRSSESSGGGGGGGSSTRKYSRTDAAGSSSSTGSVRKKAEHHHKGRGEEEEMGAPGDVPKPPPKLDWSSISALSLPKPKPSSTSAIQRFSSGAVFSRLGVSQSLAGPDLYGVVCSAVSKQLQKEQEALCSESGNCLPESLLERPFGDSEFAMTGVSMIRNAKENCRMCTNIGPNRQALVASADFALRRKLRKAGKDLLQPSPSSSGAWNSDHFTTAALLYNSLGTKASGKPAFRLETSTVGSLLIPK